MNELINSIKEHEGFVSEPYNDSLGFPTLGYGTKLPLSKKEAELILKHRLNEKIESIIEKKPFILTLPQDKQFVLFEMAYQLGVGGILKFKRMWKALEDRNYKEASVEMLDSRWAKQTPNRAKELSERMRA
jgi:lysozyme